MSRFPRVLVTGGAGYVGSALVPRLLSSGHQVTVLDLCLYGEPVLPLDHPNLHLIRGDIREGSAVEAAMLGQDAVLHLACISNDPSFELDPHMSTTINRDAFAPLVAAAKLAGVGRFVYCSSSSVYGVSDAPDVTEDAQLNPLTLYSQYKAECEPLLLDAQDENFEAVIIRPATLCGYAPRCRLDLSVNILTNHAVNRRAISIFGGSQLRPNLHIDDMCDAYLLMLDAAPTLVCGQTFNIGHQNLSIDAIAQLVKRVVEREIPGNPIAVDHVPTDDLRSYHVNSAKIERVLGYRPKRSIDDAVVSLCCAFTAGALPHSLDDDRYFNVRMLQSAMAV